MDAYKVSRMKFIAGSSAVRSVGVVGVLGRLVLPVELEDE